MKDLREKLEKLRTDAEDCRLISRLATDKAKRGVLERLLGEEELKLAAALKGRSDRKKG